jgi:hypothetical protein
MVSWSLPFSFLLGSPTSGVHRSATTSAKRRGALGRSEASHARRHVGIARRFVRARARKGASVLIGSSARSAPRGKRSLPSSCRVAQKRCSRPRISRENRVRASLVARRRPSHSRASAKRFAEHGLARCVVTLRLRALSAASERAVRRATRAERAHIGAACLHQREHFRGGGEKLRANDGVRAGKRGCVGPIAACVLVARRAIRSARARYGSERSERRRGEKAPDCQNSHGNVTQMTFTIDSACLMV